MHTFQPYPIDLIELNPFTKFSKEWALVSTGTKKKTNTMTVSWGGVGVLWGKNVVTIYIRKSRYTKELLDKGQVFSIAFLPEKYRDMLNYCGANSGRDVDKFENTLLSADFKHGIPYPDQADLVILCNTLAEVPITLEHFVSKDIESKWYADGDLHTMYIGEILEVIAR